MSSIFSKIIAGEIPSYKIYEDEYAYAFLDINPIKEGHTLVVSKKEVNQLFDLGDADYEGLMIAVKTVAEMLKQKIVCERIGVIVDGYAVPHAHVHLVPTTGPRQLNEELSQASSPEELTTLHEKITRN